MTERAGTLSLGELLMEGRSALETAGSIDAALDCRLLVAGATGVEPIDFVGRPELPLTTECVSRARAMIARRITGEPVHRILGVREFYGLALSLSEATLEPRPDTETLVDLVLPCVREVGHREGLCRVLDLGTGTGAIALALLSQVISAHAVGVDISEAALATADENARRHGLQGRFKTLRSDWFENVTGQFHVIVANPPYIGSQIIETLECEVRNHDPMAALDGGPDGLSAYREISAYAGRFLLPGGCVAVEIGHDQKDAVIAEFTERGFRVAGSAKDLGGRDRALVFAG